MWETMGPIADRTRERLGASDLAIVQFRRIMIDATREFLATGAVIGQSADKLPQAALRSFQGVVPKSAPWRTLGATDLEVRVIEGPAAAQ
jgi:phthalate 4,5-dioxygenase oxygenase subunit